MTSFRRPPALDAAELDLYVATYGRSVRAMDQAVSTADAGEDLIDLTHGDTRAFVPPPSAWSDFADAVRENTEAYSPYRGSAGVRNLLAPRLETLLGRSLDPAREIVLTPGTQGGLFTSLSSLVTPGDVVAFPSTEYFMDERICAYVGATAHRLALRCGPTGVLTIDQDELDRARRCGVRGVVLSHPNNPTGGVYQRATLERLAAWSVEHDLWVVVDELYCRLVFDDHEFVHLGSLPGMAERTVTLVGPSKTESMSGYRVGVAVGPRDVVDAMEQVISMTALRTAGYAQHALRHWMDDDDVWLKERTVKHQEIRDVFVSSLRSVDGVTVSTSAGSSYVFPDVSGTPWARAHGSNDDFALTIALKQRGVLVSPGYQFGLEGRGHFRVNFSQDAERLARASQRIRAVLSNA